ncbi:hypothetical protein B0H21DRAFT_179660 [Amylocystis lapponica]|nr:hypothetical protein B0H21DRAFT_179660 [Amylocystis lapponica]
MLAPSPSTLRSLAITSTTSRSLAPSQDHTTANAPCEPDKQGWGQCTNLCEYQATYAHRYSMPTISLPPSVVNAVKPTATDANGRAEETPEIAGAVVGSVIGFAWLVGSLLFLYKFWRRHRSARHAGLKSHRELLDPPPKPDAYIIPPDPAVIQGVRAPGEKIFWEKHKLNGGAIHAKPLPVMAEESAPTTPLIPHSTSAPPVPSGAEDSSSSAILPHLPPIPRRKSDPPYHQ